jgi:hypothetical protein
MKQLKKGRLRCDNCLRETSVLSLWEDKKWICIVCYNQLNKARDIKYYRKLLEGKNE